MNKILRNDFLLKCLFLCEIRAVYVHVCFGSKEREICVSLQAQITLTLLDLWKIEHKENNKGPSPSNEENISTTMKKTKYEESRVRKFNQAWKKEFPWVEFDKAKNEMFCRVCRKYPSVCDKVAAFFWVLTVHRGLLFVVKA